MLSQLRTKIKAVIKDNSKTGTETYTASGRSFTITQTNATSVTSVTVNGTVLAINKYDYILDSQIVTIAVNSVKDEDAVIINYVYTKYSITELNDYIRSTLIFMDCYTYPIHFDIESGDTEIYPIPTVKEQNLIIMIACILIQPDYAQYSVPGITIRYPRTLTKERRIELLVAKFKRDTGGIVGVIEINGDDL